MNIKNPYEGLNKLAELIPAPYVSGDEPVLDFVQDNKKFLSVKQQVLRSVKNFKKKEIKHENH